MKVTETWERVVRQWEGLPEHRSWGIVGMWAQGDLDPKGWCSSPAENVPVPIFLLRCCLHPQWRRREGGGDELEGETVAGVGGRWV